jgi:hypothetical protein
MAMLLPHVMQFKRQLNVAAQMPLLQPATTSELHKHAPSR